MTTVAVTLTGGKLVTRVREAEIALTGRRWCSHHMGNADASKGSMVAVGKGTRWICTDCQAKRKAPRRP